MIVFVPAIGDLPYKSIALERIHRYYDGLGLPVHVQETWPLPDMEPDHRSWAKIIAHECVDDDFILCQDLDLVPMPWALDIRDYLDYDMINGCLDCSRLIEGSDQKYWMNGGLVGIPREYKSFMRDFYSATWNNPKKLQSGEQYYLAEKLDGDNIPVHHLPIEFNVFYKPILTDYTWASFVHFTYGCANNNKLGAMGCLPFL